MDAALRADVAQAIAILKPATGAPLASRVADNETGVSDNEEGVSGNKTGLGETNQALSRLETCMHLRFKAKNSLKTVVPDDCYPASPTTDPVAED